MISKTVFGQRRETDSKNLSLTLVLLVVDRSGCMLSRPEVNSLSKLECQSSSPALPLGQGSGMVSTSPQ